MGIYIYKCKNINCKNNDGIKIERKMTDDAITTCPNCNSPLERVWSAINSVWNCSGAYGVGNH